MSNIPESVTHDEVIAALRPLLNLLGIHEYEVYADRGITFSTADARGDDVCGHIHLTMVAREVGDHAPAPRMVHHVAGIEKPPSHGSSLAWVYSVKVTK